MQIVRAEEGTELHAELVRLRGYIAEPQTKDAQHEVLSCPIKSGTMRFLCDAAAAGTVEYIDAKRTVADRLTKLASRLMSGINRENRAKEAS